MSCNSERCIPPAEKSFDFILSTANENRDWRIFSDFAWILIKEAQQLYAAGRKAV